MASEMKQRAEYEKTVQPDFRTSDCLAKARRLFNLFLDECVNFAELLRSTTIQEETRCEELLDKPEQIRNSVDRLNLLKEMLTDELLPSRLVLLNSSILSIPLSNIHKHIYKHLTGFCLKFTPDDRKFGLIINLISQVLTRKTPKGYI